MAKPSWQVNQERSQKQEKTIARELGGRTVAGSGSMRGNKGDVSAPDVLVEAKTTSSSKGNFTIQVAVWRKISREAQTVGKEAALQVDLLGERVVVLSWNYYKTLRDHYRYCTIKERGFEGFIAKAPERII